MAKATLTDWFKAVTLVVVVYVLTVFVLCLGGCVGAYRDFTDSGVGCVDDCLSPAELAAELAADREPIREGR